MKDSAWVFFSTEGFESLTEFLEWSADMRRMEQEAQEERFRICCMQHARWMEEA